MSTCFAKLCPGDFFRIRVDAVPADTTDDFNPEIPEKSLLEEEEVWYFAYGSNLSNSTFLKRRNQRPMKTIMATVPGYILRFDLPGLPYQEPSFSSIRPRLDEKDPDVIGIAYLLTREEYERLLLSEGGRDGGYMEIDVSVSPLTDLTNEKNRIICKSLSTRVPRENPHPLPSARYISLICDGAAEHQFPTSYRDYLDNIAIYTISSWKTEIGRIIFLMTWLPFVLFIFAMMMKKNKLGEVPEWVKRLQKMVFSGMWAMHDGWFSKIFGPGDVIPNKDESGTIYLV